MKTNREVNILKQEINKGKTIKQASAAANMSESTGGKYLRLGKLPSELKKTRTYKTRPDSFEKCWPRIEEFLQDSNGIEAKTIFEYLQREKLGDFSEGQLRTLQRKIKTWKAIHGPNKEVFFPQEFKPGQHSQSDFSHMNKLNITIQKKLFDHMIYHFVLPYSNWEDITICFSESFESLSEGLQNALYKLGKVPQEHQTDNLTAAVNSQAEKAEFTERYLHLLKNYELKANKTNPYSGNENGDVEQSHNRFKKYVDQQLMLRGSRDFNSQKDYQDFLNICLKHKNSNRHSLLKVELAVMSNLPAQRVEDFKKTEARVTKFSTVRVLNCSYSVPNQLIKEKVQVHIYANIIRIFYGGTKIQEMPRLRGRNKASINYRHIIDSLVRKPRAFENYKFSECLYPTIHFKVAYDKLFASGLKRPEKTYLKILQLAALEGESLVENILKFFIEKEKVLNVEEIKDLIKNKTCPESFLGSFIEQPDLNTYDDLLEGALS